MRNWTDALPGVAGYATDLGMTPAQSFVKDPARDAAIATTASDCGGVDAAVQPASCGRRSNARTESAALMQP
ncbi:MAG: hypothetical protein HS128_07390 [Ideonella sp.]|nr:hypothetical protein [Ideonella sp.]MCC7459535.1 hypothetical protein [Nitrospira sp.]